MARLPTIAMCTCLLALVVCDAAAQTTRPERPYRGLFAGGVDNAGELLTLQASTGGGYDTNVLLETNSFGSGTDDSQARAGSAFTSLDASLNYQHNGARFSMGASAATNARYYTELADGFVAAHSGSLGVAFAFSERSRITANQTVTYQPYLSLFNLPLLYGPGLGQQEPRNADFGTGNLDSLSYTTSADWTQALTRRAKLSFTYSRHVSDFSEGAALGDLSASQASGRFLYNIGKGLDARIGFGYYDAQYPSTTEGNFTGATYDLGVDFNRALSLSRRTTLTFATGTSANRYLNVTYYRFLGNARLVREFGRTWNLAFGYDRTVETQPAYPRPVLGDAGTIIVTGLFSRRLQFHSSVGAYFGNVGFEGTGTGFETYTAMSSLTLGISRHFGLNAGYTFLRYSFDEGAVPGWLTDFPLRTHRHSVQASLVVWMPLFYRPRTTDATR